MKYIWDDWMPKLSSKQRLLTDVEVESTTTPFSDALGFKCLSDSSSKTELMTDDPTPFSRQFGWPMLNYGLGEGRVELTTGTTPLSSRMGWPLLSKRTFYAVAEK